LACTRELHGGCLIRNRNCALEHLGSHPFFFIGFVLLIFLVFCVVFFGLFVFVLCLMDLILPMSLDCPFLIANSIFSNIYIMDMVYILSPSKVCLFDGA
jgi:hypothetical protein